MDRLNAEISAALRGVRGMADVGSQADASRETIARESMARGVDPSSGNFAAAQGAFGVREAVAKAAAGNAARTQVETIGTARKMDAASLGRGLASNQATCAGIALTAGNSSGANAQTPLTATQSGANILNQGAAGAQNGLAGAAATYGNINSGINSFNSNQNSAYSSANKGGYSSGMWGAVGSLAGTAAKLYMASDVNMKEDIDPVNPDAALDAVNKTPVSNWAYKAGTKGDDGGETHTGPMAQDVQKNMGEKTAPKGKAIDLISMNGMTMAAIHGLNRKVDKLVAMAA